jgi:hypothetical protein
MMPAMATGKIDPTRTVYSDDEMVEALAALAKQGVKRDDACDKVRPPNLCAFFNNLPRPERDRLLGLAYQQQGR